MPCIDMIGFPRERIMHVTSNGLINSTATQFDILNFLPMNLDLVGHPSSNYKSLPDHFAKSIAAKFLQWKICGDGYRLKAAQQDQEKCSTVWVVRSVSRLEFCTPLWLQFRTPPSDFTENYVFLFFGILHHPDRKSVV